MRTVRWVLDLVDEANGFPSGFELSWNQNEGMCTNETPNKT